MGYFTEQELKKMQGRSFNDKVQTSIAKILELFARTDGNIYVAYSGGKDSGVLLDLVAFCWAMTPYSGEKLTVGFANTGNEYAGMVNFVKEFISFIENKHGIKIDFVETKPQKHFKDVCITEGYPVVSKAIARKVYDIRKDLELNHLTYDDIKDHLEQTMECADYLRGLGLSKTSVACLCGILSDNRLATSQTTLAKRWHPLIYAPFNVSHKCCDYLKKKPQHEMQRQIGKSPILGEMAEESLMRKNAYKKTGCVFLKDGMYKAKPMGFWLQKDVLKYIYTYKLPIFKYYGEVIKEGEEFRLTGMQRTGCKMCLFGCQYKENGIHQLKELEPNVARIMLRPIEEKGFGYREVINYLNEYCDCDIDLGQNDGLTE